MADERVELLGKVAVVTGATRGIGKAAAASLGRRGARLVLVGRSTADTPNRVLPGTLEETEAELRARDVEAIRVRADISRAEDVGRVIDETLKHYGRCDVLVNNAALSYVGKFLDVPVRRWNAVVGVNLLGPVMLCHALLPGMVERGYGRIINVSSAAASAAGGSEGIPQLPYGSTKAALERLTVGLADQCSETGVAINAIRPGLVLTESVTYFAPQLEKEGRGRQPDALGEAIAALAEQPATLTGKVLEPEDLIELGVLSPT